LQIIFQADANFDALALVDENLDIKPFNGTVRIGMTVYKDADTYVETAYTVFSDPDFLNFFNMQDLQ